MCRFRAVVPALLLSVALLASCSPPPGKTVEEPEPDATQASNPAVDPTAAAAQRAVANYFRDADCFGPRITSCLAASPELDARAADPVRCQGTEARLCLVPLGRVRPDVVDAIIKFHKDTVGLDVLVLPSIPIRAEMVHRESSQVSAEDLMDMIELKYGATNRSASTFIGITAIDVRPRTGEYAWEFGMRSGTDAKGNHNRGVFSYFRMANVAPYDGSKITDDLIFERVAKYAARYTSLLYFDYPTGIDRRYLNYRDMYGFSDLDSMGMQWPTDPPPGP